MLDNFFTGSHRNIERHLREDAPKGRFEVIRHDVVEPFLVEIDEVYHLACPASPIHYKFNPVKTIKTNVVGTLNALGLAKRCKAKFLLTSTSEVYGDPLEHPQKESYWGNVNPIANARVTTKANGALRRSRLIITANTDWTFEWRAFSTRTVRAWPWTTEEWYRTLSRRRSRGSP